MRINRWIGSFNSRKPEIVENINPHFPDRMRWTRCAQIVSRYFFGAFQLCEQRRKNSLTSAFVVVWKERMGAFGLEICESALERAKATPFGFCLKHCLRQLRNSSPKIYSCYDRQLYSRLQISHKIERGRQLQGFINLAKSHGSLVAACWWNIGKAGQLFVEGRREP